MLTTKANIARGYAPPYGGGLLGANGSGQRRLFIGSGVKRLHRSRKGKGFVDTAKKIYGTVKHYGKKAYDYYKGNKDLQDIGKSALNIIKKKGQESIRKVASKPKTKELIRKAKPVIKKIKENYDKYGKDIVEKTPALKNIKDKVMPVLKKGNEFIKEAVNPYANFAKGGRIRKSRKRSLRTYARGIMALKGRRVYKGKGIDNSNSVVPLGLRP